MGYKKNILKILNSCDLVILPSYHEGTPKILLEAAACGKSIVCTSVAGCKNIVKNQYNGLLVPPRNTNKLSQAIIKICKSKSLRKKFMDNNLKLAKKSFSLDKVINIHFKIYETY